MRRLHDTGPTLVPAARLRDSNNAGCLRIGGGGEGRASGEARNDQHPAHGLHALATISSGALDRFPNLRLMIGHGGEALPFWLWRLDYMNRSARSNLRNGATQLKKTPEEYLKENFYVTTSGMPWAPVITFLQAVLGMDRVLYAMDYPYQYSQDEVTATDNVPISAGDKVKLFQKNAERVFAL